MTTKTKSASESLAELDEQLRAAAIAVAEVNREHDAAHHRAREVEAELGRALAADKSPKQLETELAKAKIARDETPWTARRQGVSDKLRRITAERGAFVLENVEEIVAERAPNAQAICEDVRALLSQSLERLLDWHRERQEYSNLFRDIAGIDGSDMPNMPAAYEALMRDIRRALGVELPAPLPMSVGPGAREIPPKSRTASGGFAPTLISTNNGQVIPQ